MNHHSTKTIMSNMVSQVEKVISHTVGKSVALPEETVRNNPGILNFGFNPVIGNVYKLWPAFILDRVKKSKIYASGWECIIEGGGYVYDHVPETGLLLVIDRFNGEIAYSSRELWVDTIVLYEEKLYEVGSENLRELTWKPPNNGMLF